MLEHASEVIYAREDTIADVRVLLLSPIQMQSNLFLFKVEVFECISKLSQNLQIRKHQKYTLPRRHIGKL
jgi:hypothetical protein